MTEGRRGKGRERWKGQNEVGRKEGQTDERRESEGVEGEKSERIPIMIFTRPDSEEVKVCLKKKNRE